MLTVVLYRPEIPPNTGNIGRLTLGTGTRLRIVGKPNFKLDEESAVKRAGLDYWHKVQPVCHANWTDYLKTPCNNRYLLTKFADYPYHRVNYQKNDHLIFGGETRGVPDSVKNTPEIIPICLPMKQQIRAYNLANSVAAVLFEALRQISPDWFSRTPYSTNPEESNLI